MAKIIAKNRLSRLDQIELLKNGIFNIIEKNNKYEIKISFIKSGLEKEMYIKFIIPNDYKKCFPFLNIRKFIPESIFNERITFGLVDRNFITYIEKKPMMRKGQFYMYAKELKQSEATFSLLGFKVLNELNNFIVKEKYCK